MPRLARIHPDPHASPSRPVRRGLLAAALAVGAVFTAGCNSSLFTEKDYLTRPITPAEVQQIDAIDLAEQSRTKPQTVEEATQKVLREVVAPTTAPSSVTLSIEEVRAAALANNLDLKVEILNPQIAQTVVDQEEAKFESTFFASARRSKTDSPTALGTEGSQSTVDAYDVGIDIPLRTGGFVNIRMPLSDVETNNPFATLNPAYTADAEFSISQPLLRNAGVNVNTNSIRVARYEKSITDAQTKLEAIRILANAERAYWILYAARKELEVRQEQYELAVKQRDQAQRRVQAGDAAQIEVTRAESGVAETLQGIIIAAGAIQRRQRDLKRIMNREDLPLNGPTELLIGTDPNPVSFDLDGDALAKFAISNRMEMLEEEIRIAIAASNIDFTRNQKLPLVTLDYLYRMNGLGSSYGRAFDQLGDRNFEDWALGVSVDVPIGNEAAQARYNRAVLDRLQRLATKALREAAIEQEVYDALDTLHDDWQRILAARLATVLATRTYEAEVRQFDVGLRTSTDVLDAATSLTNARSQEVLALADYQISQIDIAFATGTLLGRERVRWDSDMEMLIEEPQPTQPIEPPASQPATAPASQPN